MDKLGIEPTLLAAQVVNFLIILVLLNTLLYKPILIMLEKRKKDIEDGVKMSESMKLEEERMNEKHEKVLAKAREEALSIIEDAKKQGKEVEKDLVSKAHAESLAIIERGRDEAKEVARLSQATLTKQAVDLSVVMSRRLLGSIMTVKEQNEVIDKKIKDLEVWANGQRAS